ncbi:MAG TPA: alpha/beta family hydrolase [Candidatus Binataceae bacterium]|nr:alpha/beta family hydrolase [Candidatus Binataceae bacterium]
MKEESVVIPSGQLKLEGLIARPSADRQTRAAVVCHPHPLYGGSMHNNVVEAILEAFWKLGFATLRFNFRGVGSSGGEHSGAVGEMDDAKAAMKFVLAQSGIAPASAVMAGYSFGAAIAMRAGVETKEVGTIAAIALPVAMGDFSSVARSGKRIVLVAGDRDAYCPEPAISQLAGSLAASLRVIKGADHFFGGDEQSITSELAKLMT